MAVIPILAAEALLRMNKTPVKNVAPSWNRTWASHNLWLQVQHSHFWTKLTFTYKTETLGSLYNHAALILTESVKSKNQVVHEQKFKDLLSSTWQGSPERIALDLESIELSTVLYVLHWDISAIDIELSSIHGSYTLDISFLTTNYGAL